MVTRTGRTGRRLRSRFQPSVTPLMLLASVLLLSGAGAPVLALDAPTYTDCVVDGDNFTVIWDMLPDATKYALELICSLSGGGTVKIGVGTRDKIDGVPLNTDCEDVYCGLEITREQLESKLGAESGFLTGATCSARVKGLNPGRPQGPPPRRGAGRQNNPFGPTDLCDAAPSTCPCFSQTSLLSDIVLSLGSRCTVTPSCDLGGDIPTIALDCGSTTDAYTVGCSSPSDGNCNEYEQVNQLISSDVTCSVSAGGGEDLACQAVLASVADAVCGD